MPHLSVVFVEDVLDVFVVAFDPGGTLRSRVGLSSHGRPPVAEHGIGVRLVERRARGSVAIGIPQCLPQPRPVLHLLGGNRAHHLPQLACIVSVVVSVGDALEKVSRLWDRLAVDVERSFHFSRVPLPALPLAPLHARGSEGSCLPGLSILHEVLLRHSWERSNWSQCSHSTGCFHSRKLQVPSTETVLFYGLQVASKPSTIHLFTAGRSRSA